MFPKWIIYHSLSRLFSNGWRLLASHVDMIIPGPEDVSTRKNLDARSASNVIVASAHLHNAFRPAEQGNRKPLGLEKVASGLDMAGQDPWALRNRRDLGGEEIRLRERDVASLALAGQTW